MAFPEFEVVLLSSCFGFGIDGMGLGFLSFRGKLGLMAEVSSPS